MIVLGILLLIIGFVAGIAILWTLGIVVVIIGVVLVLLGMAGRTAGPMRDVHRAAGGDNAEAFIQLRAMLGLISGG